MICHICTACGIVLVLLSVLVITTKMIMILYIQNKLLGSLPTKEQYDWLSGVLLDYERREVTEFAAVVKIIKYFSIKHFTKL